MYAALNQENDGKTFVVSTATLHPRHFMHLTPTQLFSGTLSVARATGSYASGTDTWDPDAGSLVKLADDSTFEFTFLMKDSFSSSQSFVFFDDDTAVLSAVHTMIPMKQIISANTASMARITEDEFLAGIQEFNTAFNVPAGAQEQSPMTSDEVLGLEDTFPNEDEWCGGLISDTSCTSSLYEEPAAQMKGGFIALFVIIGGLIFGTGAFLLHRKSMNKQKKRYKEHFVRGIARNITIAPSAGMVSAEQLKKEFDHIDKDKGGTISKDELKKFVESGKIGEMDKKDFDAMWSALDADGSGEIDFVVRPKIVHNEIYSYFVHGHSHSLCHIIIKCFYRSLQLSLVAVGMSLTRLARNRRQ